MKTVPSSAASNHSPRFYVDEDCLKTGVKTLCALTFDWLSAHSPSKAR